MKRYLLIFLVATFTFTIFAQGTYIPRITKDDVFQGEVKVAPLPDSLVLVDEDEYVLQKGDRISILVMDHIEFTKTKILVLPDGRIEYPLLGSIKVAGLTSAQLSAIIKEQLRPYVTIPVVTIYIDKMYGHNLNIIGYVNAAGEYQIYEPIRITDALALAKGIVNIREVKTIRIIRKDGEVFNVNLKHIWFADSKDLEYREHLLLYPGDTLVVPPPRRFNWRLYTGIITTLTFMLQIYLAFR